MSTKTGTYRLPAAVADWFAKKGRSKGHTYRSTFINSLLIAYFEKENREAALDFDPSVKTVDYLNYRRNEAFIEMAVAKVKFAMIEHILNSVTEDGGESDGES